MSRIAVARARADIKDMYVDAGGREMVPFLEVLDGMVKRGVEVRLIHAKDPGPNWRDDFDRYPTLWTAMERMLCPRVHFKCIIVDGRRAYSGSGKAYIQSAFSLDGDGKADQEKVSLRRSGDFFAKLIVTSGHEQLWTDEEGMSHVGVIPFLLKEEILARILKRVE